MKDPNACIHQVCLIYFKSKISRNRWVHYIPIQFLGHFFIGVFEEDKRYCFPTPHCNMFSWSSSSSFTGHSFGCTSFKRHVYNKGRRKMPEQDPRAWADIYLLTHTYTYVWRLNATATVTRRMDGALNPNGHKVDVWQNRPFRLYIFKWQGTEETGTQKKGGDGGDGRKKNSEKGTQ